MPEMNEITQNPAELVKLPLKVRKTLRTKKLTLENKQIVLEYLMTDFNLSKAAAKVGVTRRAVEMMLHRDPAFKESYNLIAEYHTDNAESSLFVVASQPSREGFNDRKLLLQSRRREIYGNNPEIVIGIQVNNLGASGELHNLTSKIPITEIQIIPAPEK
jgi:hypothetical protein